MAQRLRYPELSPGGVARLRALEHYLNAEIALPAVLLELVRLRCSLLNGCEYCVALHSAELRKHHEPESRIQAVVDWKHSEAFTPRERAALAWADAITNIQGEHASEEQFEAVNEFFRDKDLSDLTLAIASINAWNRMAIAFRPEWRGNRAMNSQASATASSPQAGNGTVATVSTQDGNVSSLSDDGSKVAQD